MNAKSWQLVETIFEQALEQAPEARGEFLQNACAGEAEIISEVEQLLSHHDAAEGAGFLNDPPGLPPELSSTQPQQDAYIGTSLGPYQIQRKLGQGGMGNVYLAVRSANFRQQVAIKLLRPGMNTEHLLQRFRNEIQVLSAVSQHENIAALLDAGTTSDGLPYFVMEYVEGEPLDSYCHHHRYNIRERVSLFRQVCSAVHFAHQHMIIHRDLKTSNILVRTDGTPKLIDFGIAKLTTPEFGVDTIAPTAVGSGFMTMEYASPEQARGGALTTVSDVYSLGVVLYELLCGCKPYSLADLGLSQCLEAICDVEPAAPSSMVQQSAGRQSGGDVESSSASTIFKKLRTHLSGDLDNIVLKALRKEPQRRYGTAEGLSNDLGRFLEGKPVEARPIGTMEHIYRWCRHNPAPSALLVAVLLVFSVGLWHLSRLNDQLIQSAAINAAALEAQTLTLVQDFYAKTVVAKVKDDVPVSHLYTMIEGAIPIPATFTIDLGEHLRKSKVTDMSARLYSDFPFRNREGGGVVDDFEKAALRELRADPSVPFYRFETYNGRPSLRYSTASVMQEVCVGCHNTHPDSMRTDWNVGDVRGVLEIIRPLDADVIRIHESLRETFFYMLGISISLLGLAIFYLRVGRQRLRAH